jgi:CDP-diacylglycerol pyrophosphatase
MFCLFHGQLSRVVFAMALVFGCSLTLPAQAIERSDILLDIVSNCVNPALANYCSACRVPRIDVTCTVPLECKKTTEVWALNDQYTVIRDIKMCGCPSDFVHGLAMPRAPVRGVEDPKRPGGIWQFAWDVAVSRMASESIALVVNPQQHRSQNQLHVHLLRLRQDARAQLESQAANVVSQLDEVWSRAAQAAAAKGLDDYGVIVIKVANNAYQVVVTPDSPEDAFTTWRCD